MKAFPFFKQPDTKDCGPTCLRIISKFYGKSVPLQYIRDLAETTREGSGLFGLSNAAEALGFRTLGVQIDFETLKTEVPLPCILHWNSNHFVVLYKIGKDGKVYLSDPAYGLISYSREEFIRNWIGEHADAQTEEGIALVLEAGPGLFEQEFAGQEKRASLSFLARYLITYRSLVIQLAIGLIAGSLLALVFPFLTQSIVDVGIQHQDLNFITLILLAQLMLFAGRTGIEVIRGWILLHLSTRINISIISDFFIKLMRLPISFFDTRMTGDIMQRINDHHRIEQLLTTSSLSTLFSMVNLIIFSAVLFVYDYRLFLVYLAGAVGYAVWITFFLKKRKALDYRRFSQVAEEQSKVIELINGMQEIKLHNAETQKRWGWEFLQVKLFRTQVRALSLEQWQSVGGNFINQIKDILVSFLAARLVLSGDLTLGMMVSVQYIIGQLNSPLVQLIDFIRQAQDARISLERLGEIHSKADEDSTGQQYAATIPEKDIQLSKVGFRYTGAESPVFEQLDLVIPHRKTTAIVGSSGSGKTTLLKLLMKFYPPSEGTIKIGPTDLKNLAAGTWRHHCGVVMQDGYVFNDTIASNIAVGADVIDKDKLRQAVEIANLKDFIESLPLSYNTVIGAEGVGLSGGQKQRLFIARAVYKSPAYLFFDEATSALDANNEKVIIENLERFFEGRTAVVIAHRLSTVRHADKIVVLDKGRVVEEGTHNDLVALRGEYYRLIKNQLELGS
ncbi:peptidase domain-containing ABC transporter [Pedobacter sp. JY14-1]|uniref:peptidase domain-containing ABC transporter n=1 Tax=Pedobacter sp. JY14-1 TaxID=3034151 RepID=UPI0023E18F83|nr:peptidase domain-containing ABC transporter [Pedobacter sp. JY14-1]